MKKQALRNAVPFLEITKITNRQSQGSDYSAIIIMLQGTTCQFLNLFHYDNIISEQRKQSRIMISIMNCLVPQKYYRSDVDLFLKFLGQSLQKRIYKYLQRGPVVGLYNFNAVGTGLIPRIGELRSHRPTRHSQKLKKKKKKLPFKIGFQVGKKSNKQVWEMLNFTGNKASTWVPGAWNIWVWI